MSATKKVSTLQRLARVWEESTIEPDAADMGTAFGLDAITTLLEPEALGESPPAGDAPNPSRFELRLHRRSTL